MAFNARNVGEIFPTVEVSKTNANVNPGAVASATPVSVTAACSLQGLGVGPSNATFSLGDLLLVLPPAAAAINGLTVQANPTATPGTAQITFFNFTGGPITPVAAIYTIVAVRFPATFF